jgi:hypothetical protein
MKHAKATMWSPAEVRAYRSWSLNQSAGQRGEAPLGFWEFDDLKGDTFRTGGLGRLVAGMALIDIDERDGLAGGILDGR